jgi:predicted tellurium resistance membrane protein TerC
MGGGFFLIWKAVKEIHVTVELETEESKNDKKAGFAQVVAQIVLLDIVFSLDSVITAVGLTDNRLVIIAAVIVSFGVILFFAKPIGDFILENASLKILALAFLIVIGVTIFMEGMGWHVDKKLIYVPMGFAMFVQFLQMRHQRNATKKTGISE